MSANGQAPQQQAPPPELEDRTLVQNALLRAVRVAAEDAAGSQDPREAQELGAAALSFSQAFVVLEPTVDQNGVPLAHHQALAQAHQAAAAPAPARSGQARTG